MCIMRQTENLENYLFPIVGTGEQGSILCGTVKYTLSCGDDGHQKQFVYHNCGNPTCPDCYRYWLSRACDRIVPSLMSIYNKIHSSDKENVLLRNLKELSKHKYSHWVVSLPVHNLSKESPYEYLDKLRSLNLFGIAIYHPYRHTSEGKDMINALRSRGYSGGSWEIWRDSGLYENPDTIYFSPHIHLVTVGYIPKGIQAYYRLQGVVIRKIRDIGYSESEVQKVVSYQLSHCAYCGKSKSYRYLGLKRGMRVVIDSAWSKPEPLLCPDCGRPLHRFVQDEEGKLRDDGIVLESHRVYTGYIYLDEYRKPKIAKLEALNRELKRIMKSITQKEEKLKCENQSFLPVYC